MFNRKKYDDAIKIYLEALHIRTRKFGEIHVDVAFSYRNLGGIYLIKKNYHKAEEYIRKSLEISLKINGENNIFTANCFRCLGVISLEKEDYMEAEKFLEKSRNLFKNTVFGQNEYEFFMLLENLLNLFRKTKQTQKYDDILEIYIDKAQLFYGEKSKKYVAILKKILEDPENKYKIRLLCKIKLLTIINKLNPPETEEGNLRNELIGMNSREDDHISGELLVLLAQNLINENLADKKIIGNLKKAFKILIFSIGFGERALYVSFLIAAIYWENNNYKKCYQWMCYYLNSGFEINFEFETTKLLVPLLLNLGRFFFRQNSENKNKIFEFSLKVLKMVENDPTIDNARKNYWNFQAHSGLSTAYSSIGNIMKEEEHSVKALNYAISSKVEPSNIAAIAGNLVAIYREKHDFQKMNYYLEIYVRNGGLL